MNFGFIEGKSGLELLSEISARGIAGESRSEVALLMNDVQEFEVSRKTNVVEGISEEESSLEVLRNDKVLIEAFDSQKSCFTFEIAEYAIVRHNIWSRMYTDRRINQNIVYSASFEDAAYYIAGINDEGQYFMRPLQRIPWEIMDEPRYDLQRIVDWVNRKEQGFRRLQGDLLIKFCESGGNKVWYMRNAKTGAASYKIPDIFDNWPDRPRSEMANESNIIAKGYTLSATREYSAYNLGNHLISSDRRGIVSRALAFRQFQEPVIVDGKFVQVEHPEHAPVKIDIPYGQYAVLATQRGRRPINLFTRGDEFD